MSEKSFLRQLKLDFLPGIFNRRGQYVADIPNSDVFGKVYTILDKAIDDGIIEEDDEKQAMSVSTSYNVFYNDDFYITLIGNLADDSYRIILEKTNSNSGR